MIRSYDFVTCKTIELKDLPNRTYFEYNGLFYCKLSYYTSVDCADVFCVDKPSRGPIRGDVIVKEYAMRLQCPQCALKHLAQASALVDEAKNGYPSHKWFAIGHMAEAESEYRPLAQLIREHRLLYQDEDKEPPFNYLIETLMEKL